MGDAGFAPRKLLGQIGCGIELCGTGVAGCLAWALERQGDCSKLGVTVGADVALQPTDELGVVLCGGLQNACQFQLGVAVVGRFGGPEKLPLHAFHLSFADPMRHTVFDAVDNESPTFVDLTGDAKPEIICNSGGTFGYAGPTDWSTPLAGKWPFTSISGKGPWGNFNHGLGIGDVNGDGIRDLLVTRTGAFNTYIGSGSFSFTSSVSFPLTGAQQLAFGDFNGDFADDVAVAQSTALTTGVLVGAKASTQTTLSSSLPSP